MFVQFCSFKNIFRQQKNIKIAKLSTQKAVDAETKVALSYSSSSPHLMHTQTLLLLLALAVSTTLAVDLAPSFIQAPYGVSPRRPFKTCSVYVSSDYLVSGN